MPESYIVGTTADWAGVPLAMTTVGTIGYPLVNLADNAGVPIPVTSAAPSVSAMGLVVWQANPAVSVSVAITSIDTIGTILGTQIVSVVPGLSVSAQVSGTVSVSVMPAVSGTVSISGPAQVSGTVSAIVSGTVAVSIPVSQALGTVVTVLGTLMVSAVPGLSVSAVVSGTVTVDIAVSDVLGTIIAVSGVTAVSNVSTVGTVLGTVAVSVANITATTAQPGSGVTGVAVWPGQPVNTACVIMVTSTAIAVSANAYLFTVWTGNTVAVAGTSLYVVPAGKALRVAYMGAAMTTSAVVGGTVQVILVQGVAASFVSASFRTQGFVGIMQGVVTALPVQVGPVFPDSDVGAGVTIGVMIVASTACVLQNAIVNAKLF